MRENETVFVTNIMIVNRDMATNELNSTKMEFHSQKSLVQCRR